MYWNPNYEFFAPTGWRCPSCGRVYSPLTYMCPYCGGNQKGKITTTTDDSEWWKEYLKQNTTGKPSCQQDYINTTATDNIQQEIKTNSDTTASTSKNIAITTAYNCIDVNPLDSFMKHFRGLDE